MDADRRRFLGTAALTAGGVAVATLVPLPVFSAQRSAEVIAKADENGLWSLDDACGHWPPYSHPIPYGRPDPEPMSLAHVDPIDHFLMA